MTRRRLFAILEQVLIYAVVSAGLVVVVFPYLWMFLGSFKVPAEVYTTFLPRNLTDPLKNYRVLFFGEPIGNMVLARGRSFSRAFLNSFIISATGTISVVISGAIAGYALSKLNFRGKQAIWNFLLYQMPFPFIMFIVPLLVLMMKLHLVDTYLGMVLPFAVSPWAIFMYAQFFRTIPTDLIDAARIDGCSEWRIIFKIMLPLATPVTVIIGLFTFIHLWDEFLWYLIVSKKASMFPLSVLLATLQHDFEYYPGVLMAGSTLLTLPILVLFAFGHKFFIRGIAMTGLKG